MKTIKLTETQLYILNDLISTEIMHLDNETVLAPNRTVINELKEEIRVLNHLLVMINN